MAKSKAPATPEDLFVVLSENIQRLRDGETTPAVSNAIVNNTSAMIRLAKLQYDYAKLTGRTPEIPLLLAGGNGHVAVPDA